MNQTLSRLGVPARIFVAFSVLIAGLTTFQALYFPARYLAKARSGLEQKALAMTREMGGLIGPAIDFDDASIARELLATATGDRELVYVTVFRRDGTVLYSSSPGQGPETAGAWGEMLRTAMGRDVLETTTPILTPGGGGGFLAAGFSTAQIQAESATDRRLTLAISAIMLLLGFAVAFWIGRYVHKGLDGMENIASRVTQTAVKIQEASTAILVSSVQQEQGATQQSSAVEETRRAVESLLKSGTEIMDVAEVVLTNAQKTQQNNQLVAERIRKLSRHTQRISEILEVIKDVANKSELLALNAALEGTKAGDAGRGFSMVANQMQRLAENVMGSVRDIKGLTTDIREATNASVLATEEGTKLASDATTSARQIAMIIQHQQTGTEQVSAAMDEVAAIAEQTATGSKASVDAVEGLRKLSQGFEGLVERFRVNGATAVEPKSKQQGHDTRTTH